MDLIIMGATNTYKHLDNEIRKLSHAHTPSGEIQLAF